MDCMESSGRSIGIAELSHSEEDVVGGGDFWGDVARAIAAAALEAAREALQDMMQPH